MKSRKAWQALLAGSLLLVFAGCGPAEGPEVKGKVTLDGQPLADAQVVFEPMGKDDVELGGGMAKTGPNGEFEFIPDETTGQTLAPGQYAVVISKKIDKQGNTPNEEDFGQLEAAGMLRQVLPARYSQRSETTLAAEIKAEEPNQLTFDLKSK